MQLGQTPMLALVASFGIAACDAGSFIEMEISETPVEISVDLAGIIAGGVSVVVTGSGIADPIIANLPIIDGVASGQVRVLAGSNRAFLVRAFDTQGLETHRGGDTLDISADAVESLAISLSPLTGSVDMGARIGNYVIAVSLTSATVAAGGTAQASATVVDAYGDTLQSPQVVWGSSNPAVATVSADGLVQGLVPGATNVGASYHGFGGSSAVTVQ